MPNGRGVAILHIPPSQAASLRSSRDPPRGEGGKPSPDGRAFAQMLSFHQRGKPELPLQKGVWHLSPMGHFLLCLQVSPSQDRRGLLQCNKHPEQDQMLPSSPTTCSPHCFIPKGCPAHVCRLETPFPGSYKQGAWEKHLSLPCCFLFVAFPSQSEQHSSHLQSPPSSVPL